MELKGKINRRNTEQLGNVKRQKIVTFLSKASAKRLTTLAGLVAKLQQSISNGEEQFIYFSNKKVIAFLTLMRESGVIHNFYRLNKESQRLMVGIYLSPAFDGRVLVVHLKTAGKHGAALSDFQMFTVPSRSMTLSYKQLLEQSQVTGPATLYVLNTQKGLLTHSAALHHKIGGEVVCAIK